MDDKIQAVTAGIETLEPQASPPPRAIAFDVDLCSLASLQKGLPGWQIEQVRGATATSLICHWNPGTVELLIVGIKNAGESLGLCRFLSYCTTCSHDSRQEAGPPPGSLPRLDAHLLVLMPADQRDQVGMMLKAGADSCLMLPIHHQDVASMLVRSQHGNQPGRHTLDLERAQKEDPWRDNGGEG